MVSSDLGSEIRSNHENGPHEPDVGHIFRSCADLAPDREL